MTTRQYIDECRKVAKKERGSESDYAVAMLLGISEDAVNRYRKGERAMDNNTARRVAELLHVEPLEVIAAAEVERAKTPSDKAAWRKWIKSPKGLALVAAVAALVAIDTVLFPAVAQDTPASAQSRVQTIPANWVVPKYLPPVLNRS